MIVTEFDSCGYPVTFWVPDEPGSEMNIPVWKPGDIVESPCPEAEWATLCSVAHIREHDGGPLVRGWHVRLGGINTYRWVREGDLRPLAAKKPMPSAPRFHPGDRVRIPELGNVAGTLEASRQGTRLVGPHHTRTWCVLLPQVESRIWLEDCYLRPAEESQ